MSRRSHPTWRFPGFDEPFDPFTRPWRGPRRAELIRRYLEAAETEPPAEPAANDDEEEDQSGVGSSVVLLTFSEPPAVQWAFLLELIGAAGPDANDDVLGRIAAGPLEGLLGRFGEEVIDRVEEQARVDEKFRRILTGVWKHGMSDEVWLRVRALQRAVTNPLPEALSFED